MESAKSTGVKDSRSGVK
jgi:hypothetical protein